MGHFNIQEEQIVDRAVFLRQLHAVFIRVVQHIRAGVERHGLLIRAAVGIDRVPQRGAHRVLHGDLRVQQAGQLRNLPGLEQQIR